MASFITFRVVERKAKTQVYGVFSLHHGDRLGTIRWWGPWRQYVFEPADRAFWSDGCLEEVRQFLVRLRDERKHHEALVESSLRGEGENGPRVDG